MSNGAVTLGKSFDSEALSAGLDLMLLLARSLRETLQENDTATKVEDQKYNWMSAIELLGKTAASQVHKFSKVSEVKNLWDSFLATPEVRNLPKESQAILTAARDRSIVLASSNANAVSDLEAANTTAYLRVKALLARKGIKQKLPSAAVPVEVVYDPAGKQYCASASRLTGAIRWAYQPKVEHFLYGLMILEHIFAHEYLSHLVPTNSHMDVSFAERWLVVALTRGLVQDGREPLWKRYLWTFYRRKLMRHVDREEEKQNLDALMSSSFGAVLAEETATAIFYISEASFWKLTGEMMGKGDDAKLAEAATKIMEEFDPSRAPLDATKVYTISTLMKHMG
jgi:hypothetical protein